MQFVRISNENRLKKRQAIKKLLLTKNYTPEKFYRKNSMINQLAKYERIWEYNFECGDNRTLKWMKEEFVNRLVSYFDNDNFVKKMGRMDRIKQKERVGSALKMNPLSKIFSRLEIKSRRQSKRDAFEVLKNL